MATNLHPIELGGNGESGVDRLETGQSVAIEVRRREIVPIIFVPGIMGTRLRNSATKNIAWDPDDTSYNSLMIKFATIYNAADKRRVIVGRSFNPDYLELANPAFLDHPERANEIGWENLYQGSYRVILEALRDDDWILASNGIDLKKTFTLPVYACGYNWTNDLLELGRSLKSQIKRIISINSESAFCEKVILVTHSMGGLVVRSACELHGATDLVLGVIHAVQPTTGAPAAYWRMKAGFERTGGMMGTIAAWALGTNGEEVTAIMGNIPGGLGLLPTPEHRTNYGHRDWLHPGPHVSSRPRSDVYEEIYLQREPFWRLVTAEYLNPEYSDDPERVDQAWKEYSSSLARARRFHSRLSARQQHLRSHHMYGVGTKHATADVVTFDVERTNWPRWRRILDVLRRKNRGGFVAYYDWNDGGEDRKYRAKLIDADGSGDGTVPASSGRALTRYTPDEDCLPIQGAGHEPVFGEEALAREQTVSWIKALLHERLIERLEPQEPSSAPAEDEEEDVIDVPVAVDDDVIVEEKVTLQPYVIVQGDRLSAIAARYDMTWRQLYEFVDDSGVANFDRLRSGDPDVIYPGEVIRVPGG